MYCIYKCKIYAIFYACIVFLFCFLVAGKSPLLKEQPFDAVSCHESAFVRPCQSSLQPEAMSYCGANHVNTYDTNNVKMHETYHATLSTRQPSKLQDFNYYQVCIVKLIYVWNFEPSEHILIIQFLEKKIDCLTKWQIKTVIF